MVIFLKIMNRRTKILKIISQIFKKVQNTVINKKFPKIKIKIKVKRLNKIFFKSKFIKQINNKIKLSKK